VSRAFQLYLRTSRPPALNIGSYTVRQMGGNLTFGVPFSETDTVYFGAGLERTKLETDDSSPTLYKEFVRRTRATGDPITGVGTATTDAIPLTVAWGRDARQRRHADRGRYQRANLEIDLIGDAKYYRAIYEHQWYRPLTRWMTLALKGELDYRRRPAGPRLPGLQELLRRRHRFGARLRELLAGPGRPVHPATPWAARARDRQRRAAVPVPGQRPGPFAALVHLRRPARCYQEGQRSASELRYSAGIGLSWISPVGPLKLSYAKPLNAKPGDRLERFQFQMGTGF
jgi:outer membrane protein insertion porin family